MSSGLDLMSGGAGQGWHLWGVEVCISCIFLGQLGQFSAPFPFNGVSGFPRSYPFMAGYFMLSVFCECLHSTIPRADACPVLNCLASVSPRQPLHLLSRSANVLLDQHLNPKLAHPVPHPRPDNKKTKYTVMKTHLFQASAAYLPEHFIRVGQLTKQVDIFSCGIVSISSSAHRLAVSVGLAWSYSRGCWTVASRPDPRQRHL